MKFESLMLRCLFVACIAVCGLIFAAMLTATVPPEVQLAGSSHIGAILLAAPESCALPPDGVLCLRIAG